jgi:chitinase
MKKLSYRLILLAGMCASMSCRPSAEHVEKVALEDYKIIGYIAGWKGVDTSLIHADKLTHINYAFANVIDGKVREGEGREDQDKANLALLRSLKGKNADLKILISVGGWTWSKGFSDAVLTPEGRKVFTASAIDYLIRHDLDGLDFDWEYPALPGDNNPYRPEDRENFVSMLQSVRQALDSLTTVTGKQYLQTIATGGFTDFVEVNNLGEAQKYLDFINIMTYDFIVQSVRDTTGHHTNLFASKYSNRSAEKAVDEHIQAGVPASKLVMGMAFYGRSWKSVNPENNGLGQKGKGAKGYPFLEISELMKNPDFSRHWDEEAHAPFLWNAKDSIFVTFEDPQSLEAKVKFVKEKGLAGGMFWEYHEDSKDRTLLTALHKAFQSQ